MLSRSRRIGIVRCWCGSGAVSPVATRVLMIVVQFWRTSGRNKTDIKSCLAVRKRASHRGAWGVWKNQAGVSLVELMVVIVLIGILSTIFYTFFSSSLTSYIDLQKEATSFTQLANQSSRVVNVLRGTTDILSAADNELAIYAYFYPSDTYVSKVRYYSATLPDGTKQLRADLTPMSANPPLGAPQTAQMRTYTIIENFYQPAGGKLFTYKGLDNGILNLPITDLKSVKGIQVNLSAKTKDGTPQTMSVQASLRNRKNNL